MNLQMSKDPLLDPDYNNQVLKQKKEYLQSMQGRPILQTGKPKSDAERLK
jgi:hypothetical protein